MEEGSITLYRQNYKETFLFFLFFAHEVIIRPRFWYFSSTTRRDQPLLNHIFRETNASSSVPTDAELNSTDN